MCPWYKGQKYWKSLMAALQWTGVKVSAGLWFNWEAGAQK